MIPTFKNINSSKNDKLPKIDKYIDDFCQLHFIAINSFKNSNTNAKIFEEYINVLNNKNVEDLMTKGIQLEQGKFIDSLKGAIQPLYHIAINKGFEIWEK